MSYLLTQMFLYMLVTFLLGLLLGWLIWRYNTSSHGDCDAVRAERDDLQKRLDACQAQTAKEKQAADELRGKNAELQSQLNTKPAPVAAAPKAVVAAPAVAAAPAAEFTGKAEKPKGLTAARGGQPDDLQQIHGIGPKLEKMLHGLGYYHFDQIANWTTSELAWVDQNLEGFKGRVTRDKWVPQAKKLS